MNEQRAGGADGAARRLTWYALRDAAQAQLALLRALARVRSQPVGALVSLSAGREGAEPSLTGARVDQSAPIAELKARRVLMQRLELAVARAARRGLFRPSCLVRSLALAELLGNNGLAGAEIRVGVRHAAGEPSAQGASGKLLEAHAWVELDGAVVGDDHRRTHSFTPLGGVRVAPPSSVGEG